MKTVRTLALLAASAFLLLASGAQAQPAAPYLPGYFTLMGGGYIPEGDLNTDHYDANTGFVGLLTFGYQVNPFFGLQTDLGYFQTSGDHDLKIASIPLAVSLKLAIPVAFVEPYVLGGGGVYFTKLKGDEAFSDESSTDFGAHLAGGVNFIFGRFQVGAEARYIWLKLADAEDFVIDGLQVMGTLGMRF